MDHGFEIVQFHSNRIYWRQLGRRGEHATIETIGGTSYQIPDWKSRRLQMSIFRGPELCSRILHQETAYTQEDLLLFIEEIDRGNFI